MLRLLSSDVSIKSQMLLSVEASPPVVHGTVPLKAASQSYSCSIHPIMLPIIKDIALKTQ